MKNQRTRISLKNMISLLVIIFNTGKSVLHDEIKFHRFRILEIEFLSFNRFNIDAGARFLDYFTQKMLLRKY